MNDLFDKPVQFKPRPYQAEAVSRVLAQFKTTRSTLCVSPTGSGKSCMFSELIGQMDGGRFELVGDEQWEFRKNSGTNRILVLCDRKDLIHQAARHVNRTGLSTAIEKAELGSDESDDGRAQVVVASVQTLISKRRTATGKVRRMTKFKPSEFALVICDEADCFIAKSHTSVLDYFKAGNPNIKIVGFTATPQRGDGQALGKQFDSVAFTYSLLSNTEPSAIGDGWLVPLKSMMLAVEGLDFSHMKITAGDFNGRELGEQMEKEKSLYGLIAGTLEGSHGLAPNTLWQIGENLTGSTLLNAWSKYLAALTIKPRTTLVFGVRVAHSVLMSEMFNRVVPGIAAHCDGTTPDQDRDRINAAFKNGDIPILSNVATHTVGFDAPKISLIVPKPTKSARLYWQMIGRGTRPCEMNGRSIVDGYNTVEERIAAIAASEKPCCYIYDFCGVTSKHRPCDMRDVLGGDYSDAAKKRAADKALATKKPMNGADIQKAEEELAAEREKKKQLEEARRAQLFGRAKLAVRNTNIFDVLNISPQAPSVSDAGRTLSEKEQGWLRKAGIEPSELPYRQAKQIISDMFRRWKGGLCSIKQAKLLSKHGYDTRSMTMADASVAITELKANNWTRPHIVVSDTLGEI